MSINYQVGELLNFQKRVHVFDNFYDARAFALHQSDTENSEPYGVWTGQEHGSVLIAIAYDGEPFSLAGKFTG